jgi:hypothetical protein
MPDQLASALAELLTVRSGLTARELVAALTEQAQRRVSRSSVNQCLYAKRTLFANDNGDPPRWSLRSEIPAASPAEPGSESNKEPSKRLPQRTKGHHPESNPPAPSGRYRRRDRLLDPTAIHGEGCTCSHAIRVKDLHLSARIADAATEWLVVTGRTPNLQALVATPASAMSRELGPELVHAIDIALHQLAVAPCPTGGKLDVDPPEIGWRTYERPGLIRLEDRWPDYWDGVDWADWTRREPAASDGVETDASMGWAPASPLAAVLDPGKLTPRESAEYRLASRGHEWVEPSIDPAVDDTDWDQVEILRVLDVVRSGTSHLISRGGGIRKLTLTGRRTLTEVLAFASYLDRADRGELVPEPRIRRLLEAFPPDHPSLLARRLEMIDNTIAFGGDPEDHEPDDDALLDSVEPLLAVPTPVSFVAEDGGPDPLRIVRKLLPGGEGTRGEPPIVYTQTLLDRALLPTLLEREPTLVVLSGNAGDGKTAFIAQVLVAAGRKYEPGTNIYDLELDGRPYLVILDGSEDAESLTNDELLADALGAFRGPSATTPDRGTVIAVNKGRLLSFLSARRTEYAFLWRVVSESLIAGASITESPYVLIDLNDRTTIGPNAAESVFGGVISKLTSWSGWRDDCSRCDAEDRCPVLFNVRSLEDRRARGQLWKTFAAVDLDDRLHTTARHLVTKVASAVVAGGTCSGIRETVRSDGTFPASSYLYNALYAGGENAASVDASAMDRVAASYDPSDLSSPSRDRRLAFHLVHGSVDSLIGEEGSAHGDYLKAAGSELERSSIDEKPAPGEPEYREEMLDFTHNVSRRLFHLDPENELAPIAPVRTMDTYLELLTQTSPISDDVRTAIIQNLNATLGVERSVIDDLLAPRDYSRGLTGRGFALLVPRAYFSVGLATKQGAIYRTSPFLESWPRALLLSVDDPARGHVASLNIPLLLYEILDRAGRGFRPATQSERSFIVRLNGFYRRLTEHHWADRPSYALYDNGTVLSRAVLDVDKLTMAEI